MIYRDEIKDMLEYIKDALNMSATIKEPMVDMWYTILKNHKATIITRAKEILITEWESRSFPKPKEFRQYLSLAYKEQESKGHNYERSETVPKNSARVRKLIETSQRNIDALTKDTPKVQCAKCGKNALRNLTADAYFEYYDHAIIDGYSGAYLCGGHTGEMIVFLSESRRYN